MLRLALRGEKIIVIHHHPQMDDDLHASSEELTEAAVLHLGHPDDPGRPVLDVPGGDKKFIVEIDVDVVLFGMVLNVQIPAYRTCYQWQKLLPGKNCSQSSPETTTHK